MTTIDIKRGPDGKWLPGNHSPNPTGRPKLRVSLTKMLQDRLSNEPDTADAIVTAWINAAKAPEMRAIEVMLDRLEGKVAEKHLNIGIIAHISEEYSQDILRAMQGNELDRENRLLLTDEERGNGTDNE